MWEYHGESLVRSSSPLNESSDQIQDNDVEEDDITGTSQQETMMDKSWMKIPDRADPTYIKGIHNFLDWACSQPGVNNRIRCPCKECRNITFKLRNEVRFHLLKKGFLETYKVWEYHGEFSIKSSFPLNKSNDHIQDNDVGKHDIIATPKQEILMDKSWMKIRNRATPTYVKGMDDFLDWACSQPGVNNRIRCPCKVCRNVIFKLRNEVRIHLLKNGFLETYEVWEYHGESLIRSSSPHNESNDQLQDNDAEEDDVIAMPLQKILTDKSWMKIRNRATPTYVKGVDNFLDWACSQPGVNDRIRCPCKVCGNVIFRLRNEVRVHLLKNGFLKTYVVWEYHGESVIRSFSPHNESNDQIQDNYVEEDEVFVTPPQKILMDKSWMKIRNRATPTYVKGIDNFLDWACSQPGSNDRIRCPCKVCGNVIFRLRNEVRVHLLKNGFLENYVVWEYHGESVIRSSSPLNESNDHGQDNDVEEDDIIATPQQEILLDKSWMKIQNRATPTYEVWKYHGESFLRSSSYLNESNNKIQDNDVEMDGIISTTQQKLLMDKSWMKIRNRATPTYVKGIDNFLNWACSQPGVNNRIRCPCKVCRNVKFKLRSEVRVHLLKKVFLDTYEVWEYHGEPLIKSPSPINESNDQVQEKGVEEDDITATIQRETLLDKSWMKIRDRADPTYIKGIDNFLEWVCSQPGVDNRFRCPCKRCRNVIFKFRNEVRFDLLKNGFLDTYEVWEYHGESLIRSSSALNKSNNQIQDNDVEGDEITATSHQGILMDKSWMKIQDRADPTYIKGIDNFLEWACSQPGVDNRIRCPCRKCRNIIFKLRNEIRVHLLKNGFLDAYEVWEYHGETSIISPSPLIESNDQIHDNDVDTSQQETLMDKSWMKIQDKSWMKIQDRVDPAYIKGIDNFLVWACRQPGVNNRIRCPCKVCRNVIFMLRNEIRVHLLKNGFLDTYNVWKYHGESLIKPSTPLNESNDKKQDNDVEEDVFTTTSRQKIFMDKSWMKIRNRADPTYMKGIDNFLEWACSQPEVNNRIRCPCKDCNNVIFKMRNEVRLHLLTKGFLDTYEVWEFHGESLVRFSSHSNKSNDRKQVIDVEVHDITATAQQGRSQIVVASASGSGTPSTNRGRKRRRI